MRRSQLEEIGLTPGAITRWVEERRLHRVHPTVYAVGHLALGIEAKLVAALFYAGPGATLCGVTAGSWLGILHAEPRRVHVCAPSRRQSLKDVRVHARRTAERIWHRRLPVAPPAQTLLDIAAVVRCTELRRALAEAEYLKLVTLREVEEVLGRVKPGSAALRAALQCHRPQLARTKSRLEEQFLLLCERHSLPLPAVNVSVAGWLVDAVWFDAGVIVELDSRVAHGMPCRLEEDHRRDLELRAASYTVLRYTWRQVTSLPEMVIADLRRQGLRE